MGALDEAVAIGVLKAVLGQASFTEAVPPLYIQLGSTAPTASTDQTQLPNGGGYTTGGEEITFGTPQGSPASCTGPSSAITWVNSSGSTWTVVGGEIWDSTSGTPRRMMFGSWTGQPISVPNGYAFQIPAGNVNPTLE